MLPALSEFFSKVHASNLGQDAVIESMIALLAVMLTVLALMIAVFGFFGYITIKEEAIKQAVLRAEKVAKSAAKTALRKAAYDINAAAYAEAQKEIGPRTAVQVEASSSRPRTKRKATKDSSLSQEN